MSALRATALPHHPKPRSVTFTPTTSFFSIFYSRGGRATTVYVRERTYIARLALLREGAGRPPTTAHHRLPPPWRAALMLPGRATGRTHAPPTRTHRREGTESVRRRFLCLFRSPAAQPPHHAVLCGQHGERGKRCASPQQQPSPQPPQARPRNLHARPCTSASTSASFPQDRGAVASLPVAVWPAAEPHDARRPEAAQPTPAPTLPAASPSPACRFLG